MIELHLSYPPSANRLWRRGKNNIYASKEYTTWKREAGWQVIAQKPGGIAGPYRLSLNAVRPDKRKRDLGNLLKAVEDLLVSAGVIEDDSKAEMISMRWVTSGEGITVRIEPAGME